MPDLKQKQPEDSRSKWSEDGARLKQPEDSRSKWSEDGARLKQTQDSFFDWREEGAQAIIPVHWELVPLCTSYATLVKL